jgi:hypothetical protein
MIRKFVVAFVFLVTTIGVVSAQSDEDWREATGELEGAEFECNAVNSVVEAVYAGDLDAVRDLYELPFTRAGTQQVLTFGEYVASGSMGVWVSNPDTPLTFDDLLSPANETCGADTSDTDSEETNASGEVLFTVVVSGNSNLRSCADTTCSLAGQASAGDVLEVIGQEGDWYEVITDDGTAFIASFLVTRGADQTIAVDEPYVDEATECIVVFDVKRGDMNMVIILSGEGRNEVVADLYRPNESAPLQVEGQLDKTFIDTGDPYIHQYYRFNMGWPKGLYNLEITRNGETSLLAWQLETTGNYNIFVHCE